MVIFHYPILTRVAQIGAEYAECVGEQGQEHFWDFLDGVYGDQHGLLDQSFIDLAATLDIDHDAVDQCVASGRHTDTWQDDLAFGRSQGVSVIPTFLIAYTDANGDQEIQTFIGVRGFDLMSRVFDSIAREIGYGG